MDKQKQARDMAITINLRCVADLCDCYKCGNRGSCSHFEYAEKLASSGYGSLKEFAERLKAKKKDIVYRNGTDTIFCSGITIDDINELLKEYTA